MKAEYFISIYLDKRRKNKKGNYPVKLRVFVSKPRKQKLYPTTFDFTEYEFNAIWNHNAPKAEHKLALRKQYRSKLQKIEAKANYVAEGLTPFTFEEFENKLYRKKGDGISIKYHYQDTISKKYELGQVGSANAYELSMNSISRFTERNYSFNKLTFQDITPAWLKDYEQYMTEDNSRSLATVGIYLRALRAIFNKAIEEGDVDREFYPFGRRKYQIPAGMNKKKALSNEQLNILYNAKPNTPEQQIAKDFWFFSFACNGMNIKDIALLRRNDVSEETLTFYRAKTQNTSKGNLTPITVYLNDYSAGIIEKYTKLSANPNSLVFDILQEGMSAKDRHIKIKSFTRFINQHIKKLCKANGLPEQVSTYWARHSFATSSIRKGVSMEFMQESLGHSNIKTTQNYFAGFDDESKKEFAKNLMIFD